MRNNLINFFRSMQTYPILNKAVQDSELSSTAFRVLYYLTNMARLNNTNTLELYNYQIMSVFKISDTQVKRITNELNNRGYVEKIINTNPQSKRPNKYIINEL